MANNDRVASRHIVWQTNIPETILNLYFNHVRMLPSWKVNFPNYVHPAIRDVVELGPDETKIITGSGEYVFAFKQRSTFVLDAAEFVKTGILEVGYNSSLELRLTVSPSDSIGSEKNWVARGMEEFKDGKWVAELAQLDSQLEAHETEESKKDQELRQDDLKAVEELKEKLSKIPPVKAEKPSWVRRLLRSGGRLPL